MLLRLDDESLDKARLRIFHVAVNKGAVGLECKKLPPTSAAAAQHSLRVYWQIQSWMGHDLYCTEWGWYYSDQGEYKPVISTLPYAPAVLAERIKCNCKKGCNTKRCSCRGLNIPCGFACSCCKNNCTNQDEDTGEQSVDDN